MHGRMHRHTSPQVTGEGMELHTALGLDHVLLLGLEAPLELGQLAGKLLEHALHLLRLGLHALDGLAGLCHLCEASERRE